MMETIKAQRIKPSFFVLESVYWQSCRVLEKHAVSRALFEYRVLG